MTHDSWRHSKPLRTESPGGTVRTMRGRIGRTVACAAALAWLAAGQFVVVESASADTWPPTTYPYGTDGNYVTGCWNDSGSVPTELNAHITYFNTTIAGSTNLSLTMLSSCDSTVDAKFNDSLDDGNQGLATCIRVGGNFGWTGSTSDFECDQWTVEIDGDTVAGCASPALALQSVWCEEFGHILGLDHENGCMAGTGCATGITYSAHHITHLATY